MPPTPPAGGPQAAQAQQAVRQAQQAAADALKTFCEAQAQAQAALTPAGAGSAPVAGLDWSAVDYAQVVQLLGQLFLLFVRP